MESQSNVSVTMANSRKKLLFLSITGIFTMVAITIAGVLVYDKVSYVFNLRKLLLHFFSSSVISFFPKHKTECFSSLLKA